MLAGLAVVLTAGWLGWRTTRDPPLIAVLPFDDLNGDSAQAYFSRGLTEEVITQLGRVAPAGFGVIAGPSVWRYRGTQLPPQRIANELGVGYILAGAVEHDASHVRVSARLIRARDGLQLWAESFDGPGDAALPLQADVAAAVARAMRSRLAPEPTHARTRPIEGEAADLYLRGRFYWNQRTEVSLKQAIEYFQQSIARAPDYAPAYAALADCYAAMVYSCYVAPAMGFAQARAALERATQLDSQAPEVLASEGYLNMYFDWDLDKAARNLEQARLLVTLTTRPLMTGSECSIRLRGDSMLGETPSSARDASIPPLYPFGPIWLSTFTIAARMRRLGRELLSILGWDPEFPTGAFLDGAGVEFRI